MKVLKWSIRKCDWGCLGGRFSWCVCIFIQAFSALFLFKLHIVGYITLYFYYEVCIFFLVQDSLCLHIGEKRINDNRKWQDVWWGVKEVKKVLFFVIIGGWCFVVRIKKIIKRMVFQVEVVIFTKSFVSSVIVSVKWLEFRENDSEGPARDEKCSYFYLPSTFLTASDHL